MDRLQTMETFIAVAEAQSFSAAARRLNVSPPVVTRAVAELEQRLGIKLLQRTTRYVRPTEAGQRYAEDVRRVLEEIMLVDEAAAGINAEPRGELVVTAPVLFGRIHITPGIVTYLNRYPETRVRALFVDRNVNLLEEGIDVAVRIGELADSTMRAIKVGGVRLVTVASQGYLETHGQPHTPQDLAKHTIVASNAVSEGSNWPFHISGQLRAQRIKPRFITSANDSAIEAAIDGFGITRALSYQVAAQLARGELVSILDDYEPPENPIHIVHREERTAASKIRTFIDLMADHLRLNL